MQPSRMTADQMTAIAHLHAQLETDREFDPLLATMVDEPIFEFHPPGGQLRGGDTLRRYYTRFLAEFMDEVAGATVISEWGNGDAFAQEYQIRLHEEGGITDHQLVSVMYGSGDRIGGERLYGSGPLLERMLGPFIDELVPIVGETQWAKTGTG